MPGTNWKPTVIYEPLMEDVRVLAELLSFPNPGQYVNDAVRRRIQEDKERVGKEAFAAKEQEIRERDETVAGGP